MKPKVIIIPDMWAEGIIEGREEGTIPPEFAKGIGVEGLMCLKEFFEDGGSLILMDTASDLVIGEFGLPVVNTLKNMESEKFFCPGSILNIDVNNEHPIGFGMPDRANAFFRSGPAFKVMPSFKTEAKVIAKYPAKNILKSGWILGENNIANKVALAEVPIEKGRVVLIGFNALQRAQSHNTFKIVFNSIFYGAAELTSIPR